MTRWKQLWWRDVLAIACGAMVVGGCVDQADKHQQVAFDQAVHDRIVHYLVQEDEAPLRRQGLPEKEAHWAMWAMFNQGSSQCAILARKLMANAVMVDINPLYQSVEDIAAMRERILKGHLCGAGQVK